MSPEVLAAAAASTGPVNAILRHGPLLIVECGPEAHNIAISKWCREYAAGLRDVLGVDPKALGALSWRLLNRAIYDRVRSCLARGRIVCAVAEEDPTVIIGFAVFEHKPTGLVLHYAHTRKLSRRQGVARAMMEAIERVTGLPVRGAKYTHHTPGGEPLARAFRLSFTPRESP